MNSAVAPKIGGLADIYGAIRRACRDAGSQAAFAERSGLSQAFVSNVLNGRKPPSDALLAAVGWRRRTGFEPIPIGKGRAP